MKLTQREIDDFKEELQKCEEAGEAIGTVHKKCADAGKPHKCKVPTDDSANVSGEKENQLSSRKKRKSRTSKQSSWLKNMQPRSREIISDSEVEEVVSSMEAALGM